MRTQRLVVGLGGFVVAFASVIALQAVGYQIAPLLVLAAALVPSPSSLPLALRSGSYSKLTREWKMEQDTQGVDRTARTIAGNVFAAYSREVEGVIQPDMERSVLARLVEAIREEVPGGTPRDILDAANAVLDAFEEQNAGVHGPRASALNRADSSVSMAAG